MERRASGRPIGDHRYPSRTDALTPRGAGEALMFNISSHDRRQTATDTGHRRIYFLRPAEVMRSPQEPRQSGGARRGTDEVGLCVTRASWVVTAGATTSGGCGHTGCRLWADW